MSWATNWTLELGNRNALGLTVHSASILKRVVIVLWSPGRDLGSVWSGDWCRDERLQFGFRLIGLRK